MRNQLNEMNKLDTINTAQNTDRAKIFSEVETVIQNLGYQVVANDFNRPWGGFFVIDENQTETFINEFFKEADTSSIQPGQKLSPKILVVAPNQRLSWQYHFRRSELWRVVNGPIAVARSLTDEQPDPGHYNNGDIVTLAQGERHRLIGLENWGIVAEIWQHTDPTKPSDENDIVRLQDDFGR